MTAKLRERLRQHADILARQSAACQAERGEAPVDISDTPFACAECATNAGTVALLREAADALDASPLIKEIVVRCRNCGQHRVASRDGIQCGNEHCASWHGWEIAHINRADSVPPAALSPLPEQDRSKAEREVFNIVHRDGLHGTFTDADLKAAGQDWGEAAALDASPPVRLPMTLALMKDLSGRLASAAPESIGNLDSHRSARYSAEEITALRKHVEATEHDLPQFVQAGSVPPASSLPQKIGESLGLSENILCVPKCAHGHTTRQVGCVSCVLVFDRPADRKPAASLLTDTTKKAER